jgi:hypothetical protein
MADFTVFVSSTFYDLRHVRGALEAFFKSLGHKAVMFESGAVPRTTDTVDRDSANAVAATAGMLAALMRAVARRLALTTARGYAVSRLCSPRYLIPAVWRALGYHNVPSRLLIDRSGAVPTSFVWRESFHV